MTGEYRDREHFMEPESSDFELLAASLRADAGDVHTFVDVLASKLEGALPDQTTVKRKSGGLFSREKQVREITVDLSEDRFELHYDGRRIQTARARAVRGIVLKTEPIPLDEWVGELSRGLAARAGSSERARLALQQLLGG